jgi:hypothetical protein
MVGLLAASSCSLALGLPSIAAAKSISLNDTGHLHLVSGKGFKLVETGNAGGTINATVGLHITVVSTNKVSAEVSISPKGGSMSGHGTGAFSVNGGTASFTGTLTINKGSGSYKNAKGNLKFSGTIKRSNDSVTVHVSGKLSY